MGRRHDVGMAGFQSVASVAISIRTILERGFAALPAVPNKNTRVRLVRSEDLDTIGTGDLVRPLVTVLLYRVDFNKTMRAAVNANDPSGRRVLPVDLHLLITAWGDNATEEHLLIGRTLQILEATPRLSGPLLDASGEWAALDGIELVLEDISNEDLMQTFYSLTCDFRLSIPYLARIVMIDGLEPSPEERVLTSVAGLRPSLVGATP
jgi:hypothetical protein